MDKEAAAEDADAQLKKLEQKYLKAKRARDTQHDVIFLLNDRLKEQELKIIELKERVVRLEADQVHKVEELLAKQKEKLLASIELEREWRAKAHDNELAKRDLHIKQLKCKMEIMSSRLKEAQDQ
jgi:hypothetical protein